MENLDPTIAYRIKQNQYSVECYEQLKKAQRLGDGSGFSMAVDNREAGLEPAVSVVIPVYNSAPYLRETLKSILGQTLRDIEVICVNDGSADDSLDILLEVAESENRMAILSGENAGVSVARNVGTKNARGKYLYFMDSDDLLVPHALELLVSRMNDSSLDLIFFNSEAFAHDESSEAELEKSGSYFDRASTYEGVYSGMDLMRAFANNKEYQAQPWGQMCTHTHFVENDLWFMPGIIHEDEIYTQTSLALAKRATCISDVLYLRRLRNNSITTSALSWKNPFGYFCGYLKMVELTKKLDLNESDEQFMQRRTTLLLNASRRNYRKLSTDERLFYQGIVDYRECLFKALITDFIVRDDAATSAAEEIAALKKRVKSLKTKNAKLKAGNVSKPDTLTRIGRKLKRMLGEK